MPAAGRGQPGAAQVGQSSSESRPRPISADPSGIRVRVGWLVAAAAAGNRQQAFEAYEALRLHGGVELGDLVLASGGIATATTDEQQAAALAPLHDEQVARYLAASRAYGKAPRPDRLAPFVAGGLVGNLWALRSATAELAANHGKTAVDRIAAITGIELRAYGAAAVTADDGQVGF